MSEYRESFEDLLADLGMESGTSTVIADTIVEAEHSYVRDLRMNIKGALKSDFLDDKQIALIAFSIAVNQVNEPLKAQFSRRARSFGASEAEVAEAAACASLLAANNVLYRFRHFIDHDAYAKRPAKIRMNVMMRPVLGKMFFELLSLAVSAVNGCEACVKSHEESVKAAGATEEQVWDTIRLTSVIVSLTKVIY